MQILSAHNLAGHSAQTQLLIETQPANIGVAAAACAEDAGAQRQGFRVFKSDTANHWP